MARLGQATRAVPGVHLFMQPVQDVNIGGRLTATQYQYTLSDVDFTELNKWAPIVQTALGKLPQIIDLTSDQQSAAPQLTLKINRDVASRLGITPAAIDRAVRCLRAAADLRLLPVSTVLVIMEVNPQFQQARRCSVSSSGRIPQAWLPLSRAGHAAITKWRRSVSHQGSFRPLHSAST
jgi:multidrug efflux pump subunit AcrB